ncbi:putative HIRA-interacting protein [Dioscorea sansibarensis]
MEEEEKGKTKTREEIEAEISQAMRARVEDFKEQADSLTLEGVRRALEKDLGLKAFSLDVHKRFIKQCLEKFFYGPEDESISKSSEKLSVEADQAVNEETPVKSENLLEETGNGSSILEEKSRGSPALVGNEPSDQVNDKDQDIELNEDIIRKAIKERADHFRANSETITLSGVRRILEGDLKLARNTLDAYKSFISHELDEVLTPPESAKASNGAKKRDLKKSTDSPRARKGSKRARKSSDSSDSDDFLSGDEETEEVVGRPKKKMTKELKANTKENAKKKKSQEESKSTSSKKKKSAEPGSNKNSESDSEGSSGEGDSHSSQEGSKKREKPTQSVYGKQVEHLKSIIKSCGMSVPPSVYRRAKQAPESKRESYLIKELEDILEKEGLSTNPSEKEIKAVKKKKERAKELEGIDMSNIVSSTRRRTTSSYIPPPKPKVVVESEDDEEEGDDEEDEEDEEDAENEEDTDDGHDDGGESSEASDEGGEDESD